MMKKSINEKLFMWFAFIVLLVIGIVWLLNTTVLESYYIYTKKKDLANIYGDINQIYSKNPDSKTTIDSELEKIDTMKNIDITIQNDDQSTVYTTSKDFSRNKFFIGGPAFPFQLNDIQFSGDDTFHIEVIQDGKFNSDFIFLTGKLTNGYRIFIRTPMQSIKESVSISNQFLIFVGAIALFVSSITAMIISKSFTKPIKELTTISKQMSELDFSKKYHVTTDDEIGMLGTSINALSSSLEKNIQELKNTNMELEKDIEETSKISEMRSRFVSDVSHELKTPIALIQGYAEGLADGIVQDEDSKKYYCDVILDEANKMAELTRGLLDLSNLEYGKNELNIQEFNITELINNLVKKQEIIFNEKQIQVQFDYQESLIVKGDTFRIEQVLTNYLNNAVKNVDENKKIVIQLDSSDKDIVRTSVFNTGKHIAEDDLIKIWDRFYKGDKSRNRDAGGSGIGLSLVKAIMKQHHGQYGCENVDGGVLFWFELKKASGK